MNSDMKEEFKWYSENGTYKDFVILIINQQGEHDGILSDSYDSENEEYRTYIRNKIKTVVKIFQLQDLGELGVKLAFDVFRLKRLVQEHKRMDYYEV